MSAAESARSIRALVYKDYPFPELVSGKTAFLIVDVTYKDAHPDYGLGKLLLERGWDDVHRDYYARVRKIIPNIQRLRAACQRANIKVVNIHVAAATGDCSDMGRAFKRIGVHSPGVWSPADSKEAQILPEVAPQPGEIVLSKTTGSVFNSTNIDWILRNMGVDNLIVSGVVTNGCVEGSVRDAADIGYEVVLVSDATTALTVDEHEEALRRMGAGTVRVRDTDQVVGILAGAKEPAKT